MKKKPKYKSKTVAWEIRWLFLVPGVLLGCTGAGFLSGDPNWLVGLPLQALSLWAIWMAFPSQSGTVQPPAEKITPLRGKDKRLNWPLFLAATVWFFTAFCFEKHWWVTGGVGAVLLLWILNFSISKFTNFPKPKENISEKVVLGSLLVITVLLRFPFLNQNFTGLQSDEAFNLFGSINVLQGNPKTPFSGEYLRAYFPYFLLAPFFKVFGITLAAGRGTAAFLSVIAVYFFYRWCRLYFGVAASGLAAVFFSYCWWNLLNSLSPSLHIATVLFEITSLYFWVLALRYGRRLYFGLAGICMALCFQSYIAGRLLLVMVAFAFIGSCFFEGRKFFKAYWKHGLFTVLCFLWLIGPYLVNMSKHPENFFGHIQDLNLLRYAGEHQQYALPFERLVTTFYSFFWPNPYSDVGSALKNTPCIDAFLGLFCFLGIILAFFSYRRRGALLALSVLIFGIFSEALAVPYFYHPAFFNGHHCALVLPILCFLMAQGINWILVFFAAKPKPFRLIGISFLVFVTGVSIALNLHDYFFKFGDSPNEWNSLGFCHIAHAKAIESYYPKNHIVVEGHIIYDLFYSSCYDQAEQFLTYQKVPVNKAAPLEMPIRAAVTKDVVLFLSDWEKYDGEKEKVRKFYPRAVFQDYKNPFGEKYLTTIEIQKEDIQKLQKEKHLKLDTPLL